MLGIKKMHHRERDTMIRVVVVAVSAKWQTGLLGF